MNELSKPAASDLGALAERINVEHTACESAFKAGVAHAVAAGRLLLDAKPLVGHGGWLAWVRDHCRFSERTARGYMQLARHVDGLDGPNRRRVADLPYREALAMLAEPRPVALLGPEPVRAILPEQVEPLSPEEAAELARCEANIEAAGRNAIAAGRAALDVKRLFTSGQFDEWLSAEFDENRRDVLLGLMDVASEPDPSVGRPLSALVGAVDEG